MIRFDTSFLSAFLLTSALLLVSVSELTAQTAIFNGISSGPANSAMLDVQGDDTGILIPRVLLTSTASFAPVVGTAVESLLIYNTNATIGKGYYYWDGAAWVKIIAGNGSFVTGAGANGHVSYWNGTSTQTYDATGNFFWDATTDRLGIGTTGPAVALDVVGRIGATSHISTSAGNLHTNRGRLAFSSTATDVNHTIYNNYLNIDGEGVWDGMKMNVYDGLNIRVGNAGVTSAVFVDNVGKVGIGTTSPGYKLEVSGNINATTSMRAAGTITNGGFDFLLGNTDQVARGNSGASRALVKDGGNILTINYAGDYTGGTRIGTLNGTGLRIVVADANGTLTATTPVGSGIVTGNGTLNTIPKWTPNGSTLGNSLITDDATTVTAAGQLDVTGGTGTDYSTAPIEIRTTAIAPRLGFHWSGVVASQISIESFGRIAILNNPGTGYEHFIANNIYAAGTIYPGNSTTYLNASEFKHPNGRILLSGNLHIDSYNGHHIYENYYTPGNVYQVVGGGSVGINTTSPSGKLHVNNADDSDMYYTSTGNLYLQNPESWSGTVRLGAAWNKPGIYVNPDLYLNSEGSVIINDNNQENWRFDGDNLISNDWGRIYATGSNLHLDAGPSSGMYLNWYAGSALYIGRGNSTARALFDGNGLYLYDGWLRPHGDNGLYFQDGGTGLTRVQADGGTFGSVSTYGGLNGWEGYSMAGRFVWMTSGNQVGLYND
ncbi:MAG: hypothetical protein KBF73_10885, partial [Flavobacteriales bacterium]|nr:hypothetical protein [Flavobacteriales bacterium]